MPYDKKTPVSVKKWYAGCAFPVNLHEPFGPYMDFSKYGATKAYPCFQQTQHKSFAFTSLRFKTYIWKMEITISTTMVMMENTMSLLSRSTTHEFFVYPPLAIRRISSSCS